MLDVQRKRLQHLMATAILELWKKETGSLSSVIIEGTICITSSSGQTTVVQVEDRFNAVIPEGGYKQGLGRLNGSGSFSVPIENSTSIDLSTSHGVSTTRYADQGSPQNGEKRQDSSSSDQVFYSSNKNGSQSSDDSDSDIEIGCEEPEKVKEYCSKDSEYLPDDLSSSGYSSTLGRSSLYGSSLSKSQLSANLTDTSPETSVIRSSFTPLRRRSASPALLMMDSPSLSTSTPKDFMKRPRLEESLERGRAKSEEHQIRVKSEPNESEMWNKRMVQRSKSGSVLDLSHQRDQELALSPPQNYTAQVRHVIRQRLLANRGSTGASEEDTSTTVRSPETPNKDSNNTSTSAAVTVDTSSGNLSYLSTPKPHGENHSNDRENWDEKVPLLPPSGPASWPSQDKQLPPPPITDAKFFLPGHFSSPLLSIGVPGPHSPLTGLPASLSPALFPSSFSAFTHHRLPLPPGISFQDLANMSKQPLASPSTLMSQSLGSGISSSSRENNSNDARSYSTQASGRSTPEVTDINGNSKKKKVPTATLR